MKSVGAALIAVVIGGWLVAAQQSGPEQAALANGEKLYADGNYRAAVEPLRQAIADDRLPVEDRNRARQMLAHSHYSLGEVSQAMAVLRELFAKTPAYELVGAVPADFRQLFGEVKIASADRAKMEQLMKATEAARAAEAQAPGQSAGSTKPAEPDSLPKLFGPVARVFYWNAKKQQGYATVSATAAGIQFEMFETELVPWTAIRDISSEISLIGRRVRIEATDGVRRFRIGEVLRVVEVLKGLKSQYGG